MALATYRPFDARPFEFLDFPEFFAILEGGDSLSERARGLIGYYAGHGRANALAYGLVAARWTLFERDTVAWQLTRFAVMSLLVVLTYILLRRLRASPVGAAAGSSLYITTEAAAHGWLRLSMMEPLASVFLAAAAILATGHQRDARWPWRLAGMAILVGAAILTKEVVVAAVPLVALVGLLTAADGAPALPRRSKRNIALVAALAAASAIALLPTLAALLGARAAAYAASYGAVPLQPSRILTCLGATLVPFRALAPNVGAAVALAAFAVLGLAAFAIAWRHTADRGRIWIPLTIALLLPLGGALAYLPWPGFEIFYTIPYLFAPALLLALAVTAIECYQPRGRWLAYAGVCGISLYTWSTAHQHARRNAAAQRLVDRTAETIAELADLDTAVFAVRTPHPQAWQGPGPTVARYATQVRHLAFPSPVDERCDRALARLHSLSDRTLLVVLSSQCRAPAGGDLVIAERYQYWDWAELSFVRDSIRVDAFRGRDGAGATRP